MVNKAKLFESIADLVKEKRIEGISDVNDYSSKKGMLISIDLKRDANPQVVLNKLFSFTQLQTTFGVIMIALVNGEPKQLTLKEVLGHYIKFQEEVITRRTRYDLKKAQDRAHILEGLAKAIDIVDDIIATIRACKGGQAEAKQALMDKFEFDEPQAAAIVAFRLGQLAGLEILKIQNELDELKAKIAEFLDILADESKVLEIVKTEAMAVRDKFADERQTEIVNVSGEVDIEDLIPEETCVFTLTDMGYIKRIPMDEYKQQRRGGRGVKGLTRRDEDIVKTMFTCSTHDYIMFFTTKGKTYRLKGYEIPEGSRQSRGMNIVNLLPLEDGERVSAMIRVPEFGEDNYFLCMLTRNGIIKRTELDAYKNVRRNGVIAINLDDDDELVWVKLTEGGENLIIATKKGMSIAFREDDARVIGRTARGVKALKLKEGDCVIGMDILTEGKKVLTVSETGYGRLSDIEDYRLQNRGGSGLTNYHVAKYGDVAAIEVVDPEDDLMLIASDGIIIRIPLETVRLCARPSKGVRVMKVTEGEKLITVVSVANEGDADEIPEDTDGENAENSAEEITE
ncbi:MAG: DNA gyrase subunit A, partial [Clostridia bacterium]|nr:DNA gyrase subunit A [Clostridia bacterium]